MSYALTTMPTLPPDALEGDPEYRAVLEWIWSFSAQSPLANDPQRRAHKMERMHALLGLLGDPHKRFPALLVAGTKGKGSTVAMLASCLRAAGYRTGRYTSPHLLNWRERTWVDGAPITTGQVLRLAHPLRKAVELLPRNLGQPTTFEVGTALAFLHFAHEGVHVAAIEVGVGGLTDATNVLDPLVSVITPVSFDHTATLGMTLPSIARHKAGILRAGRPAVLGPQPPDALFVIESVAQRLNVPLVRVGYDWCWRSIPHANKKHVANASIVIESPAEPGFELEAQIPLLGDHQRDNATAAVAALHTLGAMRDDLRVPGEALERGLAQVEWPGRLHVLHTRPLLVVDGAHNAASAQAVSRALGTYFSFRRLHLVLGFSAGKDAEGVLTALMPLASRVYVTRSHNERAADPEELLALVRQQAADTSASAFLDLPTALETAMTEAAADDLVLVTGSLFLVGEAIAWANLSRR
jgi:dihydrofolate synthase/folylpolyglutamate synthase